MCNKYRDVTPFYTTWNFIIEMYYDSFNLSLVADQRFFAIVYNSQTNSFVHISLHTYHLFPWIKYLRVEILSKKLWTF